MKLSTTIKKVLFKKQIRSASIEHCVSLVDSITTLACSTSSSLISTTRDILRELLEYGKDDPVGQKATDIILNAFIELNELHQTDEAKQSSAKLLANVMAHVSELKGFVDPHFAEASSRIYKSNINFHIDLVSTICTDPDFDEHDIISVLSWSVLALKETELTYSHFYQKIHDAESEKEPSADTLKEIKRLYVIKDNLSIRMNMLKDSITLCCGTLINEHEHIDVDRIDHTSIDISIANELFGHSPDRTPLN